VSLRCRSHALPRAEQACKTRRQRASFIRLLGCRAHIFAEGIPFALVIWVAGTLFKDLGHSDSEITLATASIGIAWSLKPLWAAALDMWKSKKFFVLAMEYAMAGLLVLGALMLRVPGLAHFQLLVLVLWVIAFCSATQDICIDGVYITALDRKRQAAFIGVQGMAWNVGRIFATAVLVWLAGALKDDLGMPAPEAWSTALLAAAGTLSALAIYHGFVLPVGTLATRPESLRAALETFADTLRDFVRKPQLLGMLVFVFLYRSGEGFLLVEAPLFLQSSLADGGVGLSLKHKGIIDGTLSTLISIVFGLLGGAFIARRGLKRSLFWMALCMNIPHLCYVYLSQQVSVEHPLSLGAIATLVSIEKGWLRLRCRGVDALHDAADHTGQIPDGTLRVLHGTDESSPSSHPDAQRPVGGALRLSRLLSVRAGCVSAEPDRRLVCTVPEVDG